MIFLFASLFENLLLFNTPSSAATDTPISYEKVGTIKNCPLIQGGATDGQFLYFACANGASHTSTELIKTDQSGKVITRSNEYSRKIVGHANDMTYNNKTNKLLLSAWDNDTSGNNGIDNKARIIDPTSLKVEGTATFDQGKTSTICYNSATDKYVANGKQFDSNYKYEKTLFTTNTLGDISGGTSKGQGITCDNSYIYILRWSGEKDGITRIVVYDWSGANKGVYTFTDMADEVENLFMIGGVLHGGVNMFSGKDAYIIKIAGVNVGQESTGCKSPNAYQYSEWNVIIFDQSCTCSEGSSAGSMGGNNNFQKIATYLSSKGMSKYAVAGILGNWNSESSMSPFINESGGGNFPNQGYGLAQWSFGRRNQVVDALKSNSLSKESFSSYYKAEYAGWPKNTNWEKEGSGVPEGVPAEINDKWLKVEIDFMFSEFPKYKIGAAHYLSTLKQYVPYVKDSDYIKEALNSAKSAGDAATILSVVFEIHQGLDPAKNPRAEVAEKMLPSVEKAIGATGGTSSADCDSKSSNNSDVSSITLDGINPDNLPEPKKTSGSSMWNSDTMKVAKILWHLFPDDFASVSTYRSSKTSCHPSRAIDLMISNYKDSSVRERKEAIAEWLMKNRKELGLTNIIYYDKSFNVWGSNDDKPYAEWSAYQNSSGSNDNLQHRNHIHISISPCKY